MIIDPSNQSVKETYKLLIGSILPRPIAFVSSISADGIPNLAPYSFFTAISSKPPVIGFSPARKGPEGGKKDTLANIEETGEFVVNVVTRDIAEPMNDTAVAFPPEVNEFEEVGLTATPAEIVNVPMVKESPIHLECKLHKVIEVGVQGAGGGFFVMGEVVLFQVADELISEGRIDTGKLDPIGRLAGLEYTTLGERFTMERKNISRS